MTTLMHKQKTYRPFREFLATDGLEYGRMGPIGCRSFHSNMGSKGKALNLLDGTLSFSD